MDAAEANDSEDYSDLSYAAGRRRALLSILAHVLGELGIDDPKAGEARWALERGEVILKLREVCSDFGDNYWPDDLHLADVVEKHLVRYLSE